MVDKDQALQFALILSAGVPQIEALRYLLPDAEGASLRDALPEWLKDKAVQNAILAIQGKPWENMRLEEKIRFAIDKHYTELAYFLYAHNYADLTGAERNKADVCRASLEAKLAGSAGKTDALTSFIDDIMAKRIALGKPKALKEAQHD